MDAFHLIFPMELFKDFNKVFLKKKKKKARNKTRKLFRSQA